jgi:hypothetical protein
MKDAAPRPGKADCVVGDIGDETILRATKPFCAFEANVPKPSLRTHSVKDAPQRRIELALKTD